MRRRKDRDRLFRTDDLVGGGDGRLGMAAILILGFAAVKFVFQFGSTAVLARLIPPAEHGVVAMAMPAMAIAIALSQFGLTHAVIQRREISHELVSTLFWFNAALGLFFALLVAALGFPAATFYGEPRVTPVFAALGLSVLLAAMLAQYTALLRRRMRIREIEVAGLVALFGSFGIAVAAVLIWDMGYWALVLQQVLLPLINFAVLIFNLRWIPASPFRASFAEARSSLHFGGHMTIYSIMLQLAHSASTVVVGRMFGDATTGAFYRSLNLANLPQRQILSALSGAFIPGMSRVQDDPAAMAALYARLVTRTDLIMMPVAILMATAADLVVAILLGPDWSATAPILAWMSVLPAQATISGAVAWLMLTKGETLVLMRSSFVTAAMILGALLIGAQFDVVTLTALYMGSLLVRLPMMLRLVARHTSLGFGTVARPFLANLAFAAPVAGGIWALRAVLPPMPDLVGLIVVIGVLLAAYGLRVLLDPALRREVGQVLRRIRGRLRG